MHHALVASGHCCSCCRISGEPVRGAPEDLPSLLPAIRCQAGAGLSLAAAVTRRPCPEECQRCGPAMLPCSPDARGTDTFSLSRVDSYYRSRRLGDGLKVLCAYLRCRFVLIQLIRPIRITAASAWVTPWASGTSTAAFPVEHPEQEQICRSESNRLAPTTSSRIFSCVSQPRRISFRCVVRFERHPPMTEERTWRSGVRSNHGCDTPLPFQQINAGQIFLPTSLVRF